MVHGNTSDKQMCVLTLGTLSKLLILNPKITG